MTNRKGLEMIDIDKLELVYNLAGRNFWQIDSNGGMYFIDRCTVNEVDLTNHRIQNYITSIHNNMPIIIAELRRCKELENFDKQLPTQDELRKFCESSGGREVHRAWRDHMLKQQRQVASERMSWDTLSNDDKSLDVSISYDVISDFLVWYAHEFKRNLPEETE